MWLRATLSIVKYLPFATRCKNKLQYIKYQIIITNYNYNIKLQYIQYQVTIYQISSHNISNIKLQEQTWGLLKSKLSKNFILVCYLESLTVQWEERSLAGKVCLPSD